MGRPAGCAHPLRLSIPVHGSTELGTKQELAWGQGRSHLQGQVGLRRSGQEVSGPRPPAGDGDANIYPMIFICSWMGLHVEVSHSCSWTTVDTTGHHPLATEHFRNSICVCTCLKFLSLIITLLLYYYQSFTGNSAPLVRFSLFVPLRTLWSRQGDYCHFADVRSEAQWFNGHIQSLMSAWVTYSKQKS